MRVVEALLIFTVAALNLSIVTGSIGTDELVVYAQLSCPGLKTGFEVTFTVGKTVGELKTVISLHTLHGNAFTGKMRNDLVQKICRGKGALLFVSAQDTITGALINGGVLE